MKQKSRLFLGVVAALGLSGPTWAADYVHPLDPTRYTTIDWWGTNVISNPVPYPSGTNTVDELHWSYSRPFVMGTSQDTWVWDTATGNLVYQSSADSSLSPSGVSSGNFSTYYTDATPSDFTNEGSLYNISNSSYLSGYGMATDSSVSVNNGTTTVADTTADTLAVSASGYNYGGSASVAGWSGVNLSTGYNVSGSDSLTTQVSTANGTTTDTSWNYGAGNTSSHTASSLSFGSGSSTSNNVVVTDNTTATTTSDVTTEVETVNGGSALDGQALTFVDQTNVTTTVTDNVAGTSTTNTVSTFNGAAQVSAQGMVVEDGVGNVATYDATGVHNGTGHGLTITDTATVITGGTTSTSLTLDDTGATFANTVTGGPARVTGVANGINQYDAVNAGQLNAETTARIKADNILQEGIDESKSGVALGLAAASHQYDLSYSGFQLSAAGGFFDGESALSIGMGGKAGKVFISGNVGVTSQQKAGGGVAVGFKF